MDPKFAVERYLAIVNDIDKHANTLTEIARLSGDNLEGNCFTNHATTTRNEELLSKRVNILEMSRHGKKILELGFNAGHSALLLIAGCDQDAEIDFMDIGGHPYVKPCYDYISKLSKVPTKLILGNSLDLLPSLVIKEHKHDIYDLIHMDGGHSNECVVNDLLMLYMLLKPGGYMIVDDAEGFILESVSRFISLGLFEVVQGQYVTKVYPHIIVKKTG